MECHSSESPLHPLPALPAGLPVAGRGQGHSWHRQGMQSGPMACLARQVPCSRPGRLGSCQRAECAVESEGLPLGWAADPVCGGASWELAPWAGSCRNSGSTRSSLRRRPLWSWAPLLCTRFSSSTRPGDGRRVKGTMGADPPMLAYHSPAALTMATASLTPAPMPPSRPLSQPFWSLNPSGPCSSPSDIQAPASAQGSLRPPTLNGPQPFWSLATIIPNVPSMSQVCRFPVILLGAWASEFRDSGGRWAALSWIVGGPP